MYTTIRALIDSLDKYKVISMFALKTYEPEIDMYLDKRLPVLLSGRQDGNFMYLVQHPKSRSGANEWVLSGIHSIELYHGEDRKWLQTLKKEIKDYDGTFQGDPKEYTDVIFPCWWIESYKTIPLFSDNNISSLNTLKEDNDFIAD